ncbi:MAG: dephospho-CoA kinase [Candidatus Cloacimonetes bacterium]|nr:dephospho-CoA kinase [Candidatus Cloacimonadota bacterium]
MKQKNKKPLLVAVTGDIGSGKSSVIKCLKILKFKVWTADLATKELYDDPSVITDIESLLNEKIATNNILNRKLLRKVIFRDTEKLEKLNKYIHPKLIEKFYDFITYHTTTEPIDIVIAEIPLLYECQLEHEFDLTILISADREKKVERVMERDKCSRDDVLSILDIQMPQDTKSRKADIIIPNNESPYVLDLQIKTLSQVLRYIANTRKDNQKGDKN